MFKNFIPAVLILLPLLLIVLFVYKSQGLYRVYKAEISKGLSRTRTAASENRILTKDDISHLPDPVQKYLVYVGVVGREQVKNVRVVTDCQFKVDPRKDWAEMRTQQYNFFDDPTRIYYLKTNMSGLPVTGLHVYANARATMLIKLAGLITVADGRGPEMDRGETVTVFNEMCLMAPASLTDQRIQWETIDPLTVKATFNNNGCKISAVLSFNDKGELVNFVSDDRYYSPTGKSYQLVRWSTPVRNYKDINGFRLPTYGEAIWHFPDGDYCYARINIKDVEYNCKESI